MTQEDIDLLIKDVSARLPYKVICRTFMLEYRYIKPENIE